MTRDLGRVLVTGVSGFIGSRLMARLAAQTFCVTGWSRTDVDLVDAAMVADAMARLQPDTIFHLAAAAVRTPGSDAQSVIDDNAEMALAIASTVPENARLISVGSMAEYGHSGRLAESLCCTPKTHYAIGKYAAGQIALRIGAERNVDVIHARLFHVYGPGEPDYRLLPSLIAALDARRDIGLSDGTQSRDYVHVDDVTHTLMALAALPREALPRNGADRVVNVGTGVATELRRLAIWVAERLDAPTDLLKFGARARSPADEEELVADVGRLRSWLNSVPPARLRDGADIRALFSAKGAL